MRKTMAYKKEWFNDNDFWDRYAPIMFDENRLAEAPIVADGVTRLARLNLYGNKSRRSSPSVVDLCCGFGRITLELARMGFTATGVDLNEKYIRAAKETAAREGLDAAFIRMDVRSFMRKNAFDVAVNLYNSFGYFENPQDDLLMLKNARYSLRKGGALIIDVLGKEIAVRDYTEAEWFERAGYIVLTESNPVDSWTCVRNRWILIKGGKRWEKVFVQRLYSASELRTLLYKAGFATVEIYGDWDESPYDETAKTLIAVGRK
jgi:SAM-dependent methyltransferase